MTDLIQRLTEAIFRMEGMSAQYPNPGNLRRAPWLTKPLLKNNFWVPDSRAQGIAGAAHVVALDIARGRSLAQLITKWAPPSDKNNTARYISLVKQWAAIPDEHRPLQEYL